MLLTESPTKTAAALARLHERWDAWRAAGRPGPADQGWSGLGLGSRVVTALRATQRILDTTRDLLEAPAVASAPTQLSSSGNLVGSEWAVLCDTSQSGLTLTLSDPASARSSPRVVNVGASPVTLAVAGGIAVYHPTDGDITGNLGAYTIAGGAWIALVPDGSNSRWWYLPS